jgi:hypothetical protein
VWWVVVDVRIEGRPPRTGVFMFVDNLACGCTYAPDVGAVHFSFERRTNPNTRHLVVYASVGKRCFWQFYGIDQLGW